MFRLFVRSLPCVAFCLATFSLTSARAEEKADKKIEAPFVHVALYTFKADAPMGTAQEFAAEAEKVFAQIDSVRSFRIGKPAAKATPREFMVDPKNAYHLGIVLTFDNFDGMAKYGNDRRHNELKKKYAKYFEKVVAYDIEDVSQEKKRSLPKRPAKSRASLPSTAVPSRQASFGCTRRTAMSLVRRSKMVPLPSILYLLVGMSSPLRDPKSQQSTAAHKPRS